MSDPAATVPVLRDRELVLRPFGPADVEARRVLGVDPEVVRAFGGTPDSPEPRPMTPDEARAWVAREDRADGRVSWAVEVDGRFVGHARLSDVRLEQRKAMYGVGILARDLRGRGYGRRIAHLVLGHAFDTLGLHRVALRVFAGNDHAVRSYQAAGFVIEGVEREIHQVDGVWQDDVVMGVLEHEWRELTSTARPTETR